MPDFRSNKMSMQQTLQHNWQKITDILLMGKYLHSIQIYHACVVPNSWPWNYPYFKETSPKCSNVISRQYKCSLYWAAFPILEKKEVFLQWAFITPKCWFLLLLEQEFPFLLIIVFLLSSTGVEGEAVRRGDLYFRSDGICCQTELDIFTFSWL